VAEACDDLASTDSIRSSFALAAAPLRAAAARAVRAALRAAAPLPPGALEAAGESGVDAPPPMAALPNDTLRLIFGHMRRREDVLMAALTCASWAYAAAAEAPSRLTVRVVFADAPRQRCCCRALTPDASLRPRRQREVAFMRDVYASTAAPPRRAEEAHVRLARGDATHAYAAWLLGACVAAVAGARRARLAPEQLSFACTALRFRAQGAPAESDAARGEARAAVSAAAHDSAARALADVAAANDDADDALARVRRFVAAYAAHAAAVAQLAFLALGAERTLEAWRSTAGGLATATTAVLCAPCAERVRDDVRAALAAAAGADEARRVCAAALDALSAQAAAHPTEWLLRRAGGDAAHINVQPPRVTLVIMDAAACAAEAAEAAQAEAAGDAALPPPMWPPPPALHPLAPVVASRCVVLDSFATLCAALRGAASLLNASTAPPPAPLLFHVPWHDVRTLALMHACARVVADAEAAQEEVRVAANTWVAREQLSERELQGLAHLANALGFDRLVITACGAIAGARAHRALAAAMGGLL
jgi:hypothetical protein